MKHAIVLNTHGEPVGVEIHATKDSTKEDAVKILKKVFGKNCKLEFKSKHVAFDWYFFKYLIKPFDELYRSKDSKPFWTNIDVRFMNVEEV